MEELTINIDGKEHKVYIEKMEDGKLKVLLNDETYFIETKPDIQTAIKEEIKKKELKKTKEKEQNGRPDNQGQ